MRAGMGSIIFYENQLLFLQKSCCTCRCFFMCFLHLEARRSSVRFQFAQVGCFGVQAWDGLRGIDMF